MKKAISIVLVVLTAALVLCACGGKKKTVSAAQSACEGVWECTQLSEEMTSSYTKATMEIESESFTYTLFGQSENTIATGYCKITGSDSMVLYADKQQQVDSSGKVLQEKNATSSQAEGQPVYVKLEASGTLAVSGNGIELSFTRTK